jgi:UDP-N-acetyl-2-amino-2-deoxyglucuronate dehydrogenase
MPANVTIAMIGCGYIGECHVYGYRDLWNAGCRTITITAVCDKNIELAKKRAEEITAFQGSAPRLFTEVSDLLAARIADAADVCVPHAFHHTVAIACFEAGLHVLIEKPIGITIRASKLIIAAAAKAKRVLAVAENIRRDLPVRACTWAITKARLIGEPIAGTARQFSNKKLNLDDPKMRWRADKRLTGGGMIMDSGAHFTDMMLLLFGEVDRVSCFMRSLDDRDIGDLPSVGKGKVDVESFWHADIRFKSGMQVGWTFCNAFYGPAENTATYFGSAGTIIDGGMMHPFERNAAVIHTADGKTIAQTGITQMYQAQLSADDKNRLFPFGMTDGFPIELWDFADAIINNRAPELDGRAGMLAKTLCECCYESATVGRPVTFQEVLDGQLDVYQRPIDQQWSLSGVSAAQK